MSISVINSKRVCAIGRLLGLSWDDSQLRIGLIWVHIVIIF